MSPAQEYVELEERYQKVLAALHFWLPSVPLDGSEEVIDRIAKDANLLVDFKAGIAELDAETLGWIELMPQIEELSDTSSVSQEQK